MDYSKNKRVNQITTDRLTIDKMRQPIRVSIHKNQVNPQLFSLSQHFEKSTNSYTNELIKSPLQKDQFMFKSQINRTEPTISMSNSQKLASNRDPQVLITRSFPSLQLKQTFNYLEQIISDLSERDEFSSTRKYVRLISGKLAQSCEKIILRIQKGQNMWRKVAENYSDSARKILNYYFRIDITPTISPQRVMNQLQKAVKSLLDNSQQRRMSSKQKIKENKLLNSKLQKQSQQLHRFFEQEKAKLKQNYQQIYRKIYQQKSKYKKQLERSNKQIEEEQRQQRLLKQKCEKIFKDISEELGSLKVQYRQIKEQNTKDKSKIAILKDLLFSKQEENSQLNQSNAELVKQIKSYNFQILNYKAAARAFQTKIESFQGQIDQLKAAMLESKLLQQLKQQESKNKVDKAIQTEAQTLEIEHRDENHEFQSSNFQLFSKIEEIQIRIRDQESKKCQNQQSQVKRQQLNYQDSEQQHMPAINESNKQDQNSQISFNEECSQAKHEETLHQIQLKQVQLQELKNQYSVLCERLREKQAQFGIKIEELKSLDALLVDKQNNVQLFSIQLEKIQLNVKEKNMQLCALNLRTAILSKKQLEKEMQLERIERQLAVKIAQSENASIQANEVQKEIQIKEKFCQDLRKTQVSYRQTIKELSKAEKTKNLLQNDIVELMEVLVRLQSDKMIKIQMLEQGGIRWVQKFWKWMKEVKGVPELYDE